MTIYVALLHSIVLGVGRRVVMTELRAMAAGLGFKDPRTLVATGNLIFETGDRSIPDIETMLETNSKRASASMSISSCAGPTRGCGLSAGNPFADGLGSDVVVRVMRRPLDEAVLDMLYDCAKGPERIAIVDGDLWVDFASKPSLSRLLPALTTKRLCVGTVRN